MARPRQDPDATPTSTRILAAAEGAFARAGFAAARLADVAAAAGIRRPSLLYHFERKERLYAAVVEHGFARLRAALDAAMAPEAGSFAARIEGTTRAFLEFLRAEPDFARLLLRELLDGRGPGRELLLAHVVPLLDAVEAFVTSGQGRLRRDVSPRAVLLQVASAALVRAAAGPLEEPLWGRGEDPAPRLVRLLLLEEEVP